jgi:hypothetical protein
VQVRARGTSLMIRGTILGMALVSSSVACRPADPAELAELVPPISIRPSPSPYSRVTSGAVQALVPDGWEAVSLDPATGHRGGFVASPELERWARMDGSAAGMTATWVDATRVGVPSDFYYLAATGPLLTRLNRSEDCRAHDVRVFLDRKPAFLNPASSPGDYVARGSGTCSVEGRPTRWAYFVAAPGYGPVHRLGIPSSGLYVVVAVVQDSERARPILRRLVERATFGDATVGELLAVARQARIG